MSTWVDMTGSVSTWTDMTGSVSTWADRLKMLDLSERREFRDFTKVDTALIAEVSYVEIRTSPHPPPPRPPPPAHTYTCALTRAQCEATAPHGACRRWSFTQACAQPSHGHRHPRSARECRRRAATCAECRLGLGAFVFVCRAAAGPGRKGAGSDRRRGERAHGCARGVCACVHMYV